MAIDRILPGEEFVDRELVARARFVEGQQAAAHRRDDFGLPPDHPALRAWGRQVSNRQPISYEDLNERLESEDVLEVRNEIIERRVAEKLEEIDATTPKGVMRRFVARAAAMIW